MPDDCWVLRAPRLNANDDGVTLARWLAPDHATVAAGQPIAEIETEKATAEIAAEVGGTLLHAAATGASVPIGAPLAFVGPTRVAAEDMRRAHGGPRSFPQAARLAATAKAQALTPSRPAEHVRRHVDRRVLRRSTAR